MTLQFSTKAGTLKRLQKHVQSARIAPLILFTVSDWKKNAEACVQQVLQNLPGGPWIVRSSSLSEDGAQESNAGAFLSIPNVDLAHLKTSVEKVIASYKDSNDQNEVLIQPMLKNVVLSGVAFSHDPGTCAPYRVINWSEGQNTSAITGGMGGRTWQQAALAPKDFTPINLQPVITLLEELVQLFGETPIDCEFAITQSENESTLWLLQARRLLLNKNPEDATTQANRLKMIQAKVETGMRPQPFLIGKRTVYGVMPDWNPAEIVGIRPKPLALSLYRELITDSIWAYQRNNYGYRNLRSFPLMPHFSGLPYIDVRLSFNSFIPADLNEELAGKLVDYYIDRLLAEPTLHDKVEFEIVYSCYTLDLPERLKRLHAVGFNETECEAIASSLRKLTNRIIHPEEGLWKQDAAKLNELEARRKKLLASNAYPIERIYWLIEDTKRYGTLPFAGLARAGFIAVQMLQSLVAMGVFSKKDYDAFLGSVSTVSGELARDRATLDQKDFLSKYGHLRPGTYDILSPRYDEAPDLYFDWSLRPSPRKPPEPFSLTLPQMRGIEELLKTHNLHPDPIRLFNFLQAGIELREFAKFQFTRNLSDVLALITEYGAQFGLTAESLAFSDIAIFKELHMAAVDPKELLCHSIQLGKARYQETLSVSLPPVIAKPEDVWGFEWPESTPNFITQKQVTARVVSHTVAREDLSGAVVCIPNADPGFDWLFSYPIAGLITAWGGANSHMAIRASELKLPAVIGAGEALYQRWSGAQRLHLDCAGKRVEVLN